MASLRHDDDEYETPQWLFDDLESKTGLKFHEDLACSEKNKKCPVGITKELDFLSIDLSCFHTNKPKFCNPPTSKNGKFTNRIYDLWSLFNEDIVMLLRWNDLGNGYGKKIWPHIANNDFEVVDNYGKICFHKNGLPVLRIRNDKIVEFPSRLTYFALWLKKK